MATHEQLLAEYKKLAKQADQRLVRIEKYASDPNNQHFKGMEKFAYRVAQKNIETYSGPGAKRFNTTAPDTDEKLQSKINDIKAFLEAPSSTKRGLTSVYKERAATFNENHGTNFTWQEYGTFFESAEWDKIKNDFKYTQTLIKAIAAIRKSGKDINEDMIKKGISDNMILDKDLVVDEIAKKLLSKGYTYKKLFL